MQISLSKILKVKKNRLYIFYDNHSVGSVSRKLNSPIKMSLPLKLRSKLKFSVYLKENLLLYFSAVKVNKVTFLGNFKFEVSKIPH